MNCGPTGACEEQQVEAERDAIDQDEAQKRGRDNRIEPQGQARDDRHAELMEPVDQAHSARRRLDAHVATLPWAGIRNVISWPTPGSAEQQPR